MIGYIAKTKNGDAGAVIRLPLQYGGNDVLGRNNFTYQSGVRAGRIFPMPIGEWAATNFHNYQPDETCSVTSRLSGYFGTTMSGYAGDWSIEGYMYFISASFGAPFTVMAKKEFSDNPPYPIMTIQTFGSSVRIASNGTSFTDTATDTYTNKWYWFRFRKRTTAASGKGLYLDYAPANNPNDVKTASHGTSANMASHVHELGIGSYPHGQNDGTTNINGYMCDIRIFLYERTGPPNF